MFYNLHMSNGCYYSWYGVLAWKYGLANSSNNNILIKYGPAAARIHNFVFGRFRRIVARVRPPPPSSMTCCLPFSRDSYWHSHRVIENLCREVCWSDPANAMHTQRTEHKREFPNEMQLPMRSMNGIHWNLQCNVANYSLARSWENQWSGIIILDWHCIRRNSACAATIYSRTANIAEILQFYPFRA